MARPITFWYDKIITEKNTMSSLSVYQPTIDNAQTLLNDITTNSRVARWRLFVWAVAACAYAIDVIVDLAVLSLELLAKQSQFGTIPWYNKVSLEFQYGDTLVLINNKWQYPTINTSNQIIKRSAAHENGNIVNVKVAKLVGVIPTKLNSTEKTAYTAYILKLKPAGVNVHVISDDPDEVRLFLKINFDPLLLDNTGQSLAVPGTYPVEEAVNSYLSNLNFNFIGTLELSELVDKIQTVGAVKSAYVTAASARYGTNPFVFFTERYQANAGHMIIDSGNPLNTTITYQAV